MTDEEMRSIVLRQFYVHRRDGPRSFSNDQLDGIDEIDYDRICKQLDQHGLLEIRLAALSEPVRCQITASGVDVMEGNKTPPIAVIINDSRVSVSHSTNVQIGNNNAIKTELALKQIVEAIDRSQASSEEKAEAKSCISKLANNATFASIIGAIVGLWGSPAS